MGLLGKKGPAKPLDANKIVLMVILGAASLAIISSLFKDGSFSISSVQTGNIFSILIVAAVVFGAFVLMQRRNPTRQEIFLILLAIAILYFVYTKIDPNGLKLLASVVEQATIGVN